MAPHSYSDHDDDGDCNLMESMWEDLTSPTTNPYQWAAIVCCTSILLTFAVSTLSKNFSQVDKMWSVLPVVYAWMAVCDGRTLLMACCATVWGVRLTYNFHRRGGYHWPAIWKGEEDYRWSMIQSGQFLAILKNPVAWVVFNLTFISFYQNVLLLWIASPSMIAYTMATKPACRPDERTQQLGFGDVFIALVFMLFVWIESVADEQQFSFQTEKHRRIKAVKAGGDRASLLSGDYADGFKQTGLFAIVRKPNYAAEQAIWATFLFFSLRLASWNWSCLGIVQLVALFQMSGWFTEKISRSKYERYADYMKRVPLFVPNPFCWWSENKTKAA